MSIDAIFSVDIERARTLDVAIFGGNAVCRAVDGVLAFELDIEGLACIDACFRASLDVGIVEGNRASATIERRFLEDNGRVAQHSMLVGIAYPCACHIVVILAQLADDDFATDSMAFSVAQGATSFGNCSFRMCDDNVVIFQDEGICA